MKIENIDKYDLDSPERTLFHKEIIKKKTFLKLLYVEWYNKIKELSGYKETGTYVELGSGGGFIKDFIPNIITSDVFSIPGVDLTFSAHKLPFEDHSIDGIFMVDVFHHIPEPQLFLSEASRVLKPNGVIVMSEPWNTPWSKFIFRNFHHEPFEPTGGWTIPETGALSGANGALPWIFFKRDQSMFVKLFPKLKIELIQPHSPLRYLLSGGLTLKQLVPSWSFNLFKQIDRFLSRLNISMFAYIVIRKI